MDILEFKSTLEKIKLPYCNIEELPPIPIGNYVAVRVHNNLAYISGQMPFIGQRKLYPSQKDFKNEPAEIKIGYTASQIAMMNTLLHLANNKIITSVNGIIKIEGYFARSNSFYLPKMLDGASDLVTNIFPYMSHARTVCGVDKLPFDAIVELSVIAEVNISTFL